MGLKVLKFGGSSVADADQLSKIKAIVEADPERRYVVVSAPGKRHSNDNKVTDMLFMLKAQALPLNMKTMEFWPSWWIQEPCRACGVAGEAAEAPMGQPRTPLDRERIEPGVWNVFPAVDGDHMYLQGGLTRRHDVRAFYLGLLTLISAQGR